MENDILTLPQYLLLRYCLQPWDGKKKFRILEKNYCLVLCIIVYNKLTCLVEFYSNIIYFSLLKIWMCLKNSYG